MGSREKLWSFSKCLYGLFVSISEPILLIVSRLSIAAKGVTSEIDVSLISRYLRFEFDNIERLVTTVPLIFSEDNSDWFITDKS